MTDQPKILIVDDQPLNIEYLEQELEDLNYLTISAANGVERSNGSVTSCQT